MTISSGAGYALISLGPGFSLFVLIIASKPFLVLTLLTSTLAWLVSLVAIAILWRPFVPFNGLGWVYAPLLASAVIIQELLRVYFWRVYKKGEGFLNTLALRVSKPPLSFMEKTEIALAIGLGHGLAHSVLFCVGLLTPALGPGTYYLPACPRMPFFLVISLMSLGFLLIHTFSMVVAFKAYEDNDRSLQLFVPVIHLISSFLTLVNLLQGGCATGIPLVMISAAVTLFVCGRSVWHKTG